MSDGSLPDRLAQLRSRWEADPASRIFLQLAEEYRHQGRLHEALTVLDEGLKEHPGYLSALVAKGRCLLELGQPEPAREVLERVVRQDATQMVANKLLVRTYLETGQAARARERLDLYSLLHDGDPEVEDLWARIARLDRETTGPAAPPTYPVAAAPEARAGAQPLTMPTPANPAPPRPEADVFDLGAAPAAARRERGDEPRPEAPDVFDLRPAAPPPPASTTPSPAPPPAAAPASPPAVAAADADIGADIRDDEPEPVAAGEPFAGLVSPTLRRRHLAALMAEGIFAFELPAAVSAPSPATAEAPASTAAIAPVELPEPMAPEPSPATPTAAEPELISTSSAEPSAPAVAAPSPAWAAAGAVATATLGELYLRQGHASEAERIFGEVLEREPGNAAAHEGLTRSRELQQPALPPPAEPVEASRTAEPAELAAPTLELPELPAELPEIAAEPLAELEPVASPAAELSAAPPEASEATSEPGAEPPAVAASPLAPPLPLDRRARKVQLLQGYLERIRRGSGRHVS